MNIKEEWLKSYNDKAGIYFIERFLYTFNADVRREVPMVLFPRQKIFLKTIAENQNTIAIKHRQCGCTTCASAWATMRCALADEKSPETILCIGNNLQISRQIVEKCRDFLKCTPRWFFGKKYWSPNPDDPKNNIPIFVKDNQNELELCNGCKIYARSAGPNAARGISAVSILIFDESAFIQDGPTVYAQAVATTSSVKDAKIIMVSTPNGKDQLYYKTYHQSINGLNNYKAVVFKWFQDPRYNRNLSWYRKNEQTGEIEWDKEMTTDELGNIPYNEERWSDLEKRGWTPTSPWFENMCKTFSNDEQKIAQELLVSFVGSSDNVVPPDVIEAQNNQNVIMLPDDWPLRDPLYQDTWIWEDPIPGHRYILGVDASSGSGEDRTAIEIIDIDAIDENGKPYFNQVLEYYGKITGDIIGELAYQYGIIYNNALIVIEGLGGYGDAAILTLMNKKYPNLYYDDPGLKTYTVQRQYSKLGLSQSDKLPGFRTNSMRIQMISNFVVLLKNNGLRIRSKRVITELETWIFKNGRPDHMDGCHDDSLTCLAMILFVAGFSMIKSEKIKAQDKQMLHSFYCANLNTVFRNDGTQKTYGTAQKTINDNKTYAAPPKKRNYGLFADEKKKVDPFQNACMLMGGFFITKK